MPELAIDLEIVPGDGQTAPLYKAALEPGMAPPGTGKRSMVYAHARNGMFGPLLLRGKVGQAIEIDRAGATPLHYVIREYYPRWSSTDTRWLDPAAHEELILETCTSYNPNDPRIIAVAEPTTS
jgi:sortase (surface protein transpeptidase)